MQRVLRNEPSDLGPRRFAGSDPLFARLGRSHGVCEGELASLRMAASEIRTFGADQTISAEGIRSERIHAVIDGWAARVKILENGSRQIPMLMLPGDICDLAGLHLDRLDFGTVAITRCIVMTFERERLRAAIDRGGKLRDAFARMMAVENARAMQWTVCLGRRTARERFAHLICELSARLNAVGAAQGDSFAFPLTQEELADVLGLTAVHVNRTLQSLRSEGLIQWGEQRLTIANRAALARLGAFDGECLHLPPEPRAAWEQRHFRAPPA